MRRAVVVTCVAAAVVAAGGPARADVRLVSGVVVSSANDPVPGARITIVTPSGTVVGTTITDASGKWKAKVDAPAQATLTIRVEVEGFPPTVTGIRPDQVSVRTTIEGTGAAAIELEVEGDKPLPEPVAAQPTRYALESTLLTKLPGTRGDPFAAVTSLPSVGRPPALSTMYIVRGAGPDETATFVDGAPLPNAFHFGGLVAIVPAAFVDSIAILPGGFGARYGRATAGVVDVSLASPRADGVHGAISLDAIDVGAYLTAPVVPGRDDTSIAIGARRSHVDAWIGTLLGDTISGDLPKYLDGQVLIEHRFSAKSRVRAAFLGADDSVSITDPNSPKDRPRSGSWRSDSMRVHARFETELPKRGSAFAVVSLGRSRDAIIGENDLWESARKTLFVRIEGTIPLDGPERARLTLGTDTLATRIDGTRILGVPTSSFGGSALFQLRGALTVERVQPGAYAELALEPTRGFTLTPGVRFDRGPLGHALFQPRLAVRAELSRKTAARAVTGLYARPNALDAVDAQDFEGTLLPVVHQPGPARGVHAGVGIEHAFSPEVRLIADVYGRAINGVLVATQRPAQPIYAERLDGGSDVLGYRYPLNADTGRSRAVGAEVLLRFGTSSLAGFVGYALARAELRDGPNAAWRRAPFDQTHVLNAAAIVKLGSGWEAGARFRLAVGVLDSPYPATEIAPKADPRLDPSRPLPELQPLHSLDVRLEKGWKIGRSGSVAAYVEVRNVYDRRVREPLAYNYVYGYPVVGNGLPILPNVGLRGAL